MFNLIPSRKRETRSGNPLTLLRDEFDSLFDRFYGENDSAIYRVAQQVLRGEHAWLEQGIASPIEPETQVEGEEATSVEKGEPAGVR